MTKKHMATKRTTPKRWEIPDPNRTLTDTRRTVKSYAAAHELPIAEALREMVSIAEKSISMDRPPHGATDGVRVLTEETGAVRHESAERTLETMALVSLSKTTAAPIVHPTQRPERY